MQAHRKQNGAGDFEREEQQAVRQGEGALRRHAHRRSARPNPQDPEADPTRESPVAAPGTEGQKPEGYGHIGIPVAAFRRQDLCEGSGSPDWLEDRFPGRVRRPTDCILDFLLPTGVGVRQSCQSADFPNHPVSL